MEKIRAVFIYLYNVGEEPRVLDLHKQAIRAASDKSSVLVLTNRPSEMEEQVGCPDVEFRHIYDVFGKDVYNRCKFAGSFVPVSDYLAALTLLELDTEYTKHVVIDTDVVLFWKVSEIYEIFSKYNGLYTGENTHVKHPIDGNTHEVVFEHKAYDPYIMFNVGNDYSQARLLVEWYENHFDSGAQNMVWCRDVINSICDLSKCRIVPSPALDYISDSVFQGAFDHNGRKRYFTKEQYEKIESKVLSHLITKMGIHVRHKNSKKWDSQYNQINDIIDNYLEGSLNEDGLVKTIMRYLKSSARESVEPRPEVPLYPLDYIKHRYESKTKPEKFRSL